MSKFSAVGTEQAMDSDGASPDKMCNSMKGSLIKKQVKFQFIYFKNWLKDRNIYTVSFCIEGKFKVLSMQVNEKLKESLINNDKWIAAPSMLLIVNYPGSRSEVLGTLAVLHTHIRACNSHISTSKIVHGQQHRWRCNSLITVIID